jgi:hypothetical protein
VGVGHGDGLRGFRSLLYNDRLRLPKIAGSWSHIMNMDLKAKHQGPGEVIEDDAQGEGLKKPKTTQQASH